MNELCSVLHASFFVFCDNLKHYESPKTRMQVETNTTTFWYLHTSRWRLHNGWDYHRERSAWKKHKLPVSVSLRSKVFHYPQREQRWLSKGHKKDAIQKQKLSLRPCNACAICSIVSTSHVGRFAKKPECKQCKSYKDVTSQRIKAWSQTWVSLSWTALAKDCTELLYKLLFAVELRCP